MSNSAPIRLSLVALARDEANHLEACFRSLQPLAVLPGTETVVLLDSKRDFETEREARRLAQRVAVSKFVNFATQRNRALDEARGEWVFFIDPDERLTSGLAEAIMGAIASGDCAAYRVPRRNMLFGREVKHTGWWPDHQVRLLRRDSSRYDPAQGVHEVPIVQGAIGTLEAPLIHYNYDNWSQFRRKQAEYAQLEAEVLFATGRRARLRSYLGQPLREFKRRFLDLQGYRDGRLGLRLSLAMAAYRFRTNRALAKLQRRARRREA